MNNFIYFFKRKYRQIRNLIRWTPIIWKQYDFDYSYAIEVFKFQLSNIADRMESDRAMLVRAPNKASRIRMINKLMTKVYDNDYSLEYQDEIERLYGPREINWEDSDKEGYVMYNGYIYEREYTQEQLEAISEHETRLHKESQEKQERAHKLLWELIEHNIETFWD